MTVVKQLRARTNADLLLSVRLKQADGTATVFSAAKLQVRETSTSATVLLEASITNGRITVNGTGFLVIRIPASVIAAVSNPPPTAVYDLIATRTSDGSVVGLLEGDFLFVDGVTV